MLDAIVAKKKITVEQEKKYLSLKEIQKDISFGKFALSKVMRNSPWSLIAECKLQSPSKGRLCTNYTVLELAKIYEKNGAMALSIHTDEHFLGNLSDIALVKEITKLPVLRKDFIIDEYQIYQSRRAGADAILLIARILSPAQLKEYLHMAWEIGVDCLVEVHDEKDINAVNDTRAELIGINNRNLKNFTTDVQNTLDLVKYCDRNRTIISESGIKNREDIERVKKHFIRGVLVGEGLVKAANIAAKTRELSLVKGF